MEPTARPRLEDLTPNPPPGEPLTTAPGRGGHAGLPGPDGQSNQDGQDGPGSSAGSQHLASADLTAALAQRARRAPTLDGNGPWVCHRPEAEHEAAPGGRPAGPLDTLLVAVKDLVAVAGLRLGAGTRSRDAAPPERSDATIVARLRSAGAVVAGTVGLHELAFGVTGVNEQVGFPGHPRDAGLAPGGSSSGSAVAVARGDCDLAVGTDTGGSVRIPAALCGVVGFKPSRGTYPLDGVLALAPSLDHAGLLARDVATVMTTHRALTRGSGGARGAGGSADADGSLRPARPRRLGVDRGALEAADPAVAGTIDAVLRALAETGCEMVDVEWPDPERVREVSTTIMQAEAAVVHAPLVAAGPELLGQDVAARLAAGASVTVAEHAAAVDEAAAIGAEVRATLDTVEAVVGPAVPVTAPPLDVARDDPGLSQRLVSNTRLANLTGVPALSLPVEVEPGEPGGLPVGLQMVARADALLLGLALGTATVAAGTRRGRTPA